MTPFPESEYPSILRGKDKRESLRLLEAAPDLLTGLKAAVSAIEEASGYEDYFECASAMASSGWFSDAKKAIAKAEGRTQ